MDVDLIAETRSLQQQIADLKNDPNGTQMSSPALTEALGELTVTLKRYGSDISERQQVERDLRERRHQLGERVKELNCLYGISALVEKSGTTLPEVLQGTVDLIPPAWQFPDITAARVLLQGQEFKTADFPETAVWLQAADISIHGQRRGVVQVCYLEERPASYEGPFLKEERDLINGIAERLGRIVERLRAEEGQREALAEALKIRDALRESEERFRVALDNSRIVVYNQDRDLRYTWIHNPQLGYSPEGILGKTDGELLLPEDAVVLDGIKRQVLESGAPARETVRNIIDGQAHFYDLTVEPLRNQTGDIIGVTGASTDITERKRTSELLRESEKKYRQLFELAQEGLWVIDADANTTLVNPRMAEMLGYSAEEMLGKHLYSFMDEEGVAITERNLERRRQGIKEQHDFEFLRKDGTRIYTILETTPFFDDDGAYVGGLAMVADITERRRAEVALRQAHSELETRVQERTAALEAANRALQTEIAEREQVAEELRASEEMLERRVDERTRQLATLLEISRNVALTPKLEPLLDLILDRLKSVVDYDDATIFKLEEDELIAMAHRGLVPQEDIMPQRYSLEHAPFGRELILNRRSFIIPDVRADTPLAREFRRVTGDRFETLYGPVRSWMTVPLTIKDNVVGVLTLKAGEPDYYATSLTELVRGFGDQAAVAIENTRLYEQAQTLAALEERQRLARDLHDAVSQTLFSASLAAEVLPRLWESKPDEGRQCLTELRQLTRGALAEMRTLLLELRPSALMEVELGDLLRQLAEAAGSRARIPVDVTYEGQCALEPQVQIAFYRIAQEALSNIVKHAGASRATVSLRCLPHSPSASAARETCTVELQVEDAGCGFELAGVAVDSLGLTIMRERAAAIGAEFEIESQVGRRTQVRVVWPGVKENVP